MESEGVMALLIPILAICAVFGYVTVKRYWEHRERMAAIEKGIAPSQLDLDGTSIEAPASPRSRLQSALVTTAVGVALTIGLGTIGFGPWLLGGLIPLFVGLAGVFGYLVSGGPKPRDREDE